MPEKGSDPASVIAELDRMQSGDVDWRGGRVFSLVYTAGEGVDDLAGRAVARFAHCNALNLAAFGSLRMMQGDLVSACSDLLGGGSPAPAPGWLGDGDSSAPEVGGFVTSGGTESLLMTVLVARDFARARGIAEPSMVLPTSAHAAFEKAAHYFGVRSVRVPVGSDWRADVPAMHAAMDESTALVVGSAVSYPQGVIDPIEELAEMASARGVPFHVDACMGGFLLPFLAELGHVRRGFDFRVPGVTSISVDLHKYGYAPKGISVVLYRSRALRSLQPFVTSNWLGGLYGSPSMAGTRSGAPIAAAWALLRHLGHEGYRALASAAFDAATALRRGVDGVDGIEVVGEPDATVLAVCASEPDHLDVFAVGDVLGTRGWYLDRQQPPDSLHATVHAGHAGTVGALVEDLAAAVEQVRRGGSGPGDRDAAYGTVE